jgi:putative hydrolase of the HAD superfamily
MSKPKLLLFDVAGVLYYTNTAVGDYLQKKYNLDEVQQNTLWRNLYRQYARGAVSTADFLVECDKLFGLPKGTVAKEDFSIPFEQTLKPIPGMTDLLDELVKSNFELAILSDTSEVFSESRSKLDTYKHFKKIFLSFEIGYLKPEAGAYQTVIDYFKLQPEEILFIDDKEENIAAAIAMGMRGVVFQNTEQLISALKDENIFF